MRTPHLLQLAMIRAIGEALTASGYLSVGEQAAVLGLSRSTAWNIVRAKHKTSGLSSSVIKRMLAQPQLPAQVRIAIHEYIDQKSAGRFGHNSTQLRRFAAGTRSVQL